MSDDALIEAMAQAIDASLYGNKLNAVYCYQEAKAALAVGRPIIEAPLRAENEKLRAALKLCLCRPNEIAAALKESVDE